MSGYFTHEYAHALRYTHARKKRPALSVYFAYDYSCRIRREATDPEQKAATDYKEQVDRNTSPPPPHPPEN